MSRYEEVVAKIEAQETRRPLGRVQRCFNCAYWQMDEPPEWASPTDYSAHSGECHRHAPHPPHRPTAEVLGAIRWAVEAGLSVAHDDKFDYCVEENEEVSWYWPRTMGNEWCGDFVRRRDDPAADCEVLRADAGEGGA